MKNTKKNLPKNDLLSLFLGDDYKEFELKEFIYQLLFLAGVIIVGSLFS